MNDLMPQLGQFQSYEDARRQFQLRIPGRFNIAAAACRRHAADPTRVALVEVKPDGANTYTFAALDFLSDKLASVLAQTEVRRGDRIAVILPYGAALAIAQLAGLKLAALVAPLSPNVDSAALRRTLADVNPRCIIVDRSLADAIAPYNSTVPHLAATLVVSDAEARPHVISPNRDFWSEIQAASSDFAPAETEPSTPAFLFYDAASDQKPRGVVHTHGSLLGQLPAFEMSNDLDLGENTLFWANLDPASFQALYGFLYPAWLAGCPFVALDKTGLTGLKVAALLEGFEITNAAITGRTLGDLIQETATAPADQCRKPTFRTVVSVAQEVSGVAPETVMNVLGAVMNVVYGNAEIGMIASGCARWFPHRQSSVGRVPPGHRVAVLDEFGAVVPPQTIGAIAAHKSDPGVPIGRHNEAAGSHSLLAAEWLVTGASGKIDEDGSLYILPSSPQLERET